jgi:hypothetical protein
LKVRQSARHLCRGNCIPLLTEALSICVCVCVRVGVSARCEQAYGLLHTLCAPWKGPKKGRARTRAVISTGSRSGTSSLQIEFAGFACKYHYTQPLFTHSIKGDANSIQTAKYFYSCLETDFMGAFCANKNSPG